MKKIFALLLALMLMVPAAFAETVTDVPKETEAPAESAVNPFTNIKTTLLDGSEFDASVFGDMPVMLNIWADWCGPCVGELQHLQKLSEEFEGRMQVIGLLYEGSTYKDGATARDEEVISKGKAVLEKAGVTYPNIVPDELLLYLTQETKFGAFPTTYFFSPRDGLLHMQVGANSEEGWRDMMNKVLEYIANPEAAKGEGNTQN